MKKYWFWIVLILLGCGKNQYVPIDAPSVKQVKIERNYTVVYCKCMENSLQSDFVRQLQKKGVAVRSINHFQEFDKLEPGKYYAIFSFSRKYDGESRTFKISRLVNRSDSGSCGKNCNWSKSWNELLEETQKTDGKTEHLSMMLYQIDEETKLVLALSQGSRYKVELKSTGDTGAKTGDLEKTNHYEITH